jgi:hypothetical protein
MEANELRRKNLVHHENDHIYWEVTSITISTVDLTIDDHQGDISVCFVPYKDISPIPLTEKWFIKFGFDRDCSGIFYHDKLMKLYFEKPYEEASHFLVKSSWDGELTSVKYVHQLQNLFFALTGEELKMEE